MATATKNYGTIRLQSSYYAYTKNAGFSVYRTSTPSIANSAVFSCSFSELGIPAGSIINSAVFNYVNTYPAHGHTLRNLMSGTTALNTWFTPGDTIDINSYATFFIRFQSGKDGTSYPEMPLAIGDEAAKKNIGVWKLENLTLIVNYSIPYTEVISPTNVTLSKSEATPNEQVDLSWSGAQNGTGNPISGYEVYRSTSQDSGYSLLTNSTGTSAAVAAPPHGTTYYYKIKAIGSVSGYDGQLSTASASVYGRYVKSSLTLNKSSLNFGENIKSTLSGGTSGLTHKIIYSIGAKSQTTSLSAGTLSHIFTAPADWISALIDASQGTLSVKVQTYSGDTLIGEDTKTATVKIKASAISLDKPSCVGGDTVNIAISKQHTQLTTEFVLKIGTETLWSDTATGISAFFTASAEWYRQIPNATSGTLSLSATTKNGTAMVGTATTSLILNIPSSVVPNIGGVLTELIKHASQSGLDLYIQNYSQLKATMQNVAGVYGSTITAYELTFDGQSVSASDGTFNLPNSGERTVTAKVTDSRGRIAQKTASVTVQAYANIRMTNIEAYRSDADGLADNDGNYIAVKAKAEYSSLDNQNVAELKVSYGLKGGTQGTPETLTDDVKKVIGGGLVDETKSYTVVLVATDKVSSVTFVQEIGTSLVALDFTDEVTMGGIGKYAEKEGVLECIFPIEVNGKLLMDEDHTHTQSDITDFPTSMPPSAHTHGKVDITDFPTSMPASDVYSWAKAETKPDYTASEVGVSNRNILHNWDFRNPINQREKSGAINTVGYFFDRWILKSGTVTIQDGSLLMGQNSEIEQRIESKALAGKTVTFSLLDTNGNIVYASGTFPVSVGMVEVTVTGFGTITLGNATGYMYIYAKNTQTSFELAALKLELGSVSTLAYDPPMDNASELLKCQRYFFKLGTTNRPYARFPNAVAVNTSLLGMYVQFPCRMRIIPSFFYTGSVANYATLSNIYFSDIHFQGDGASEGGAYLYFTTSSELTVGHSYSVRAHNSTTSWLCFSADL